MTINVTAVNDVPVAVASSVTTSEDTAKTFAVSDFLFTDVENNPLASITVNNLSLSAGDTLKVNQGSTVVAVTNGMTLTAAQIPTLVYTPAANANGAARSTFGFTVNDAGTGTVGATMTINVTAVNDVPVALASSVTTSEDTAKTFGVSNFLFSDVEGDALASITVSALSLATGDTLKVNQGSTVVVVTNGMTLTAAQIPTLVYTPAANANGTARSTFDFTVNDAGTGTVGATMTINVTAVNDVPVALASSVTTNEDTAKTFAVSDFLFTDLENNPLASITVSALSLATGDTLKVNQGSTVVAVTNGMTLTAAQIPTLVYTPAANANGAARSTFDFTVNDAGNGTVAATMTINVTAVNDVPVALVSSVTTSEDTAKTFAVSDFLFLDTENNPLASITISTLSLATGDTLNVNQGSTVVAVTNGMTLTAAQIPTLVYTPVADANGTARSKFDFTVNDAGTGTVAATMTINVTSVNDAPVGTPKTITTAANTDYIFAATDFGFTDPNDSPANTLLAVKIAALPAAGSLTNNGTAVTAGQFIALADLTGGKLKFTPVFNASGAPYTTFTFQVQDNGGAANGADLDPVAKTITIAVTPPPSATTAGVSGPAVGNYGVGQTLNFTVTYGTEVAVTGAPQLPLTIGGAPRTATYNATSSTSMALVFSYPVVGGDNGAVALISPLLLNNGTIKNGATDATLTFTPPNLAGVVVDTTPPTITIGTNKTSLALGGTAALTFTLSEASTNFSAADITASGGTLSSFAGSGTLYTATFTPAANSTTTAVIGVAAGTFTDATGNANTAAAPLTLTVDTVVPTIVLSSSKSSLALGETATLTFTLSEASTNFALSDIGVTGGALSGFTGISSTVYNATFTPTTASTTTAVITVAAGTFTDAVGNANTAATPLNLSVNTVAPGLVITSNLSTVAVGQTATLTFTLSAASTNFALGDIGVTGGALSGFTASNSTVYNATFTPTANSTTTAVITVAAATFTDATGNANTAATPLNLTVDTIAPTITIAPSKTSLALGETATLTFTLSEASTNFSAADITASGGTLSSFAGSGVNYTATFTPTANSTTAAVIGVAAGAFTDAAGNPNMAATPLNLSVNTVAPSLIIATNDSALAIGKTATLTFTLSAASSTFTAADVTVSGGTLSNFAGSGALYSATFTPAAASTTPAVITVAAGTFTDAVGNANTAATPLNLTVDTVAPTIGISSSKASLALGETATLTFTLSEASTNFTAADVTVSGGTLSAFAGSGTGYSATFTPTADSSTPAVITVAAATFTDAAGNNNVAATPLNLGVNTIIPRLVITSNRSALTLGQTATLTFTFTVAPSSFTANDIQVSDGTNSGQPIANVGTVTGFTATSTTVYTAIFTPAPNLVATVRVTATAGQLTSTFNLPVNSFVPTITIATNRSTLAVGETATLTFTLSAASTDFTVGDIGVTGGTLSGFTAVSGTVYTATFTPTPLSTLTAVITVAAGSFTDAGGNANTAATPLNLSVATDSAVVTWAAPAAVSYGTLLGDTQLNATANVDGTFVYTPLKGTKLNVGENQTLSVTFTPTDTVRYRAVTKTVALTVNKATPTVVWNAPANVQYFRPLTATQLNATIDGVVGTFAYTPALGSRSTLGVGQTLNVSLTFTPTDTANYNPATVAKAFPVVEAEYSLTGSVATETETFPGRLSDYKITQLTNKAFVLEDVFHPHPTGTKAWLKATISNYEYFAFSDTTVTVVTPVVKQQGVATPDTVFDTVAKGVLNTAVGRIILISAGQYNEAVAIDRDVTLIGFGQVLIASATIGGNARLGSSTVNVQVQTVNINQIGGSRSRPTDAVLLSINALGYSTASTITLKGDPNGATNQAKAGDFDSGMDLYRRVKLVGTLEGANRTIVGANPAPSGNVRYTSLIAGQPAPVNLTFRNGINLSSTRPPAPVPPTTGVYALPTY